MQMVMCSFSALSVALIFYTYRAYYEYVWRRQKTLRERVTYMLWVAADGIND